MMVFELFDIRRFLLKFGRGGTGLNVYDIVRCGPLSYGPLYGDSKLFSVGRYKSILILYNEADIKNNVPKLAEKLKTHLSTGFENRKIFPGFNELFDLSIEISTVPFKNYDPEEIYTVFGEHCGDIDVCFPLIILPRVARGMYDSIYYTTKAEFLRREVPSQVFTVDLLQDEQNYMWSLLPVAIQIFTKMGGVPYTLDRSVLGDKVSEDTSVFTMGLGISYHPLYKERGVGFLIVFDHLGAWCFMDSTALLLYEKDRLSGQVAMLLENAVRRILSLSKSRKNVLIIHYSGKEVGRAEEEAVAKAVRSAETELSKFAAVYILKIKDSDIVINDTASEYIVDNARSGYPPIGVTIQIKPGLYLMFTSGYFTGHGNKVRGNIRRGLSRAKIVSRHREMEPARDEVKLDDKALLATVFGMCRLNYNSVQNPVSREPITVRYSREIAWLSLRLSDLGVNLNQDSRIKRVMWFI